MTAFAVTSPSGVSDTQSPIVMEAKDVHKSFGDREVLKGINLTVRAGEVVVLIGPSGSGKSTFLRCVNHLESPDSGVIAVNGTQIGYRITSSGTLVEASQAETARQRQTVGMVFQNFALYPHMTVLENLIEAPIHVHRRPRNEVIKEARELLGTVGLLDRENSYPEQLSGGQQQRIAIIRAVLIHPQLLLFDEPTSALDPELVGSVLSLMKQLADDGWTMLVVTHEIQFASQVADWVIFMADGKVVEEGRPEEVIGNPNNPRTREFLHRFL